MPPESTRPFRESSLWAVSYTHLVFAAEGNPKRLLATDDGGQGCILFYNTPEWGKELEELTGMELDTQFW